MATIQDAIKRLIYQFTSTGADKVAADNNMVADSQAKLAVSAQTTTKASLDLEKSFQNLEKRFQTTAGVQQQYKDIQDKVNAAVAQHPELQARANEVLANAATKFDAAKGSGNAFAQMMESARGAALGLAAGIGPIGAVLGSFGPWGVAAAAGIGLVVNALDYMKVNAERIGDASSSIKLFSDNVGLTVTQIRGLNEAGSEVGVSSDQISAGIEKFTLNLSDARKGTGSLYDQLKLISPQLAEDVASTHDGAEAFDLLTKAINSTTDATTKAAIAKAAFGKGGQSLVQVAGVVGDAGGIDTYSVSVQKALGVTDEWTKKVADLRNENKSLEEDLKLIEASVYTESTLQRQNTFLKQQIDIAKAFRDAASAAGDFFKNGGGGPQTDEFGAPFDFTLLNKNKAAAAAASAPAASFDDRFSAAGGGAKSIDGLTQAQQSNLESTSRMAAASASLVSALGGAATAAEKEQARIESLTVSFESGKISAETYARALGASPANVAAQDQLRTLQGQLQVDQQRGALGQIDVQRQITLNELLRQEVDSELAAKVADEQRAVEVEKIHSSMDKAVQSSQDNLDKIQAQGTGMEGVVASSIAYRDAIQAGATATQAAAISANVLQANMMQAAQAASQLEQAAVDAGNLTTNGILDPSKVAANAKLSEFTPDVMPAGPLSFSSDPSVSVFYRGGSSGRRPDFGTTAAVYKQALAIAPLGSSNDIANQALAGGGIDTAINTVQSRGNPTDATGTLQTLYGLKNSQTSDNASRLANDQQFLTWLEAQPQTIANLQAISSLTSEMQSLAGSTDSLNSTMKDALSPYYTQDPRTSHIGFRSQGMATGGWVDVPGMPSANDNMVAQIPVAGGERIYVDPNRSVRGGTSSGATISISMPITITGSASKDDVGRTMYQVGQSLARQLRVAGQ